MDRSLSLLIVKLYLAVGLGLVKKQIRFILNGKYLWILIESSKISYIFDYTFYISEKIKNLEWFRLWVLKRLEICFIWCKNIKNIHFSDFSIMVHGAFAKRW